MLQSILSFCCISAAVYIVVLIHVETKEQRQSLRMLILESNTALWHSLSSDTWHIPIKWHLGPFVVGKCSCLIREVH